MRRYEKPSTILPKQEVVQDDSSDFDVTEELEKLKHVLRREVRNLMAASSKGKLSPSDSKSLADYIDLLRDMEERETEAAKKLSDAQLKPTTYSES